MLGITGDSYSHINSVFYQGKKILKFQQKLLTIDEKVLELLYSEDIKVGLSINEFYKSFKDIIPNTKLDFKKYKIFEEFIQNNRFDNKTIELFCFTAFSARENPIEREYIKKWKNNINYMFVDKLEKKDSLIINNNIKLIETFVKQPRIKKRKDESHNANFLFKYNKKNKKKNFNSIGFTEKELLNYQIVLAEISIASSKSTTDKFKEKAIFRLMMYRLGLNKLPATIKLPETYVFGEFDEDNPELFSKYDKELFTLFFHPSLKTGMTKTKVLEILRKYYPVDEFLDRKEFKK